MKYVYVLTSSTTDLYYEQFFLSVTSLRMHNPDAYIVVLLDRRTKESLTDLRNGYEQVVSEIKTIDTPIELSQKEVSRWIKTSMKKYITGDFLYIDCDTVITENLNYVFPSEINIGAILDTHVPLKKHHLVSHFNLEDIEINFNSSSKLGLRYNGGVIFCRDVPESDDFFNRWHSLWNISLKKGNSQDMPSLNQANLEAGNIIKKLDDNWNCQIIYNGLPFLSTAKIIHYYATVFDFINCPFKPASWVVLNSVKETGIISDEIMEMLKFPRNAFEQKSRIISDNDELEVLNSKLFLLLLIIRKKRARLFNLLNSVIILIRHNKFVKKIYHRPKDFLNKNYKIKANIAIDCRMIQSSGIGVYLRSCLPLLLKTNNNFFLIGNKNILQIYKQYPNVKIINCSIKSFSFIELLLFPRRIVKEINKADIYYSPYINIPRGIKIPIYTTIHDIIFPDMPELITKPGLAVRMWFYRRAQKHSKKIFTVSNFSKSRIIHHLGDKKPVIITKTAIRPKFLSCSETAKTRQKKETIIFIGNIKRHKGLYYLLDAFQLARNEGLKHKLIIVSSKRKYRSFDNKIIKKMDSFKSGAISFTGYIPDDELIELISTSSLLVQPSLYEGFCLPPLEAMVLGTHALISDIPVLKEVYADFPVTFFRVGDVIDLKNKMMSLLFNKTAPSISLSENLLSKYTFEKTVSVILKELM